MPHAITLHASVAKLVSFAMHQASIPVINALRLRNDSEETIDGITVELVCEPPVIAPRRWTFDRVRANTEVAPADRNVSLDGGLLYRLNERMRATLTLRVTHGDVPVDSQVHEIVALSRHEWGGSLTTPELLAAFVAPNDPGIADLLREASDKLREAGRPPELDGYQSQSREKVWETASAIWAAVAARRLIYAEPPASFETSGQKVRLPSEVLTSRLATCLDTSVMFAAALEQAGLRPLLCLTRGHALVGLWLQPATLLGVASEDASDLRNYVALQEMVVFETTAITSEPPATFAQAIALGTNRIRAELDEDFILALDIRQARARQILPLPAEGERVDAAERTRFFSPPLETAPALPSFSKPAEGGLPETPQGRLDAWKRHLLDLTKRNRLLNLKPSKTAIRLVCADAGKLEDALAEGSKITIVPLEALDGRGSGRDEDLHRSRLKVDFELELARQALENKQIPARLADADMKAGILELFRKAKSDLEEGGANTLFLTLGLLRWRESETSTAWHLAPLILVPVKLERATAASPPRLVKHGDDTVFNMTLLEMLRQDFEVRLPSLEGELPTDAHGVNVDAVLRTVRTAIRDVPGWEVLDEMVLSTFSFSKYLMWKDLNDHTDVLRDTAFVKHMIDTPRDAYARTPEFIPADEHDDRIDPASLLVPLSCDSSQVSAIHASGLEGDFVLEGPPGTGKSQTIANLIAHNIGLGRRVLFVAEKMTALNVVHERLRKVGLGDFCLELHSSKANKKDVLAQLDRAWTNRGEATSEAWEREAAKLKSVRDRLNGLVHALHAPGATGISPRDAITKASTSRFAPAVTLDWGGDLASDLARDPAGLAQLKDTAREIGQAFAETTPEDAAAFAGLASTEWSYLWQGRLTASSLALTKALDEAQARVDGFLELTKLPGDATSLSGLRRLADFAGCLPSAARTNLQAVLAPDGSEVIEHLSAATALLKQFRENAAGLSATYDLGKITAAAVEAVGRAIAEADATLWPLSHFARRRALKEGMPKLGADPKTDFTQDVDLLAALASLREAMDRTTDRLPASALWRGLATDTSAVDALIRSGEAVRAAITRLATDPGTLPDLRQRARTLLVDGRELLQPGMPIADAAEQLVAAVRTLESAMADFRGLATMVDAAPDSLVSMRALAKAILERTPRLNRWCQWQAQRERGIASGLNALVAGLECGLVAPNESTAAFETAYARWLAPLLIDSREALRGFSAVEHTRRVDEFRALDAELAQLAAQAIRARVSAAIPRKSASDVPGGFNVLRREAQRRIGHSPVRKLVSDMGDALTRLTPCLLMSPHSVAQFLPASDEKFDLVVFDEASQIAVWDAIGAVARGRNVIIVGDPKQMPPTSFFGRAADADESVDLPPGSADLGDLESILDEGLAAGMHHHRLTGHYRSQHESLIAFSNHNYYGGALVTYPASVTQASMVSLRRCSGAYQKGKGRTNPEEAKAVVAEIVQRLTDPARRAQTIGVVTMNAEQQRLIRNLLDDERRRLPALESAFRDGLGEEVEMVYNLETVQGHERDVILLSIGYGPTVPGDRTMSMNFGPLNRAGGERRLNVAVTRAIREVVVFASFDPDMIDLSRTSAQAVHDLKAYLDFASRGPIALARQASFNGGVDHFDSAFEEQVAGMLRQRGWTVQTQVGVSKFRIDLGIVHPDYPGRFLAGVECDGASFHSSATARDRDRIRHAVLCSLGWSLVRLWSTDYFHDKDEAIGKVHRALCERLEADRAASASIATGGPIGALEPTRDDDAGDEGADFNDDSAYGSETAAGSDVERTGGPELAATRGAPPSPADPAPNVAEESTAPASGAFYEEAYIPTLTSLCLEVVDGAGPITFIHLAEKIARAHGFQRTGSEIKKRVWLAVYRHRQVSKAPDGANTFWPQGGTPAAHVPYRGDRVAGEARPWSSVPYPEKLGLAFEIVAGTPPEQRVAAMAARIGVGKLRAKTRDELMELLESAEGMQGSP